MQTINRASRELSFKRESDQIALAEQTKPKLTLCGYLLDMRTENMSRSFSTEHCSSVSGLRLILSRCLDNSCRQTGTEQSTSSSVLMCVEQLLDSVATSASSQLFGFLHCQLQ
jgi:hypothetical protein